MKMRRRSRMSARTPPMRAKARVGSDAAAWTRATMSGDGAMMVISQAAPTDCTHCPKLAESVPSHTARNMPKRNGDSAVPRRRRRSTTARPSAIAALRLCQRSEDRQLGERRAEPFPADGVELAVVLDIEDKRVDPLAQIGVAAPQGDAVRLVAQGDLGLE